MVKKISIFEAFAAVVLLILLKVGAYILFEDSYLNGPFSFVFDLAIYLSVFYSLKLKSQIKVDTSDTHWLIYFGAIFIGLSFFLIGEIISFIEQDAYSNENLRVHLQHKSLLTANLKYQIISIIIVVPVLEELIFRGLILNSFLSRFSNLKSILVSSILFWLGHFAIGSFSEAISIFLLGLGAAWIYYSTRNVYTCILMHFSFNVSNYIIRYIYYSVGVEMLANNYILALGLISLTCLLFLITGYLSIKFK